MKIKVIFSKTQLKAAASYLAKHNENFRGMKSVIEKDIAASIIELVNNHNAKTFSVMGFILVADREYENLDCDQNVCHIEIYVDPLLSSDYNEEEEMFIETEDL